MKNKVSRSSILGILVAAGWVFVPATGCAQPGDLTGTGEFTGFVAGSFGMGTHPAAGGSAGTDFSRYGMALVEVAYQPLGTRTIQPWPAASTVNRSYLLDFNFCVHVRIPIKSRWAPYAIAGVGLLWDGVKQNSTGPYGNAIFKNFNQFNGALETGGGVRYYIRENWGIRPEAKVIVSKTTYTRVSMGIFYVLPNF